MKLLHVCLLLAGGLGLVAACDEELPRRLDDQDQPGTDGGSDAEPGPGPGPNDDGGGDGDVPGDDDDDGGPNDAGPCVEPDGGALSPVLAIAFEPILKTLTTPVEVTLANEHLYVLEQGGKVLRINDDKTASVVLDVSSKIVGGGEAGLLGIAFHPKFAENGFVYLYYTIPYAHQPAPAGMVFQSLLVRYHSTDNGLTLDPASAHPILTVDQPFTNHNGGTISFGNDGFLYWGLGDGGSGGDPNGNGQNTKVLLGKMLRIDVDGADPYAIPATNPFADGVKGAKEIYAYGLRNPYRWRFDRPTGDLWVGDVGQGAREEIDKLVLGGNFGWNVREGKICYGATTCAMEGFIEPVVDHDRTQATTIIGGVVYRGAGIPALTGRYVYGDFGRKVYYTIPTDAPAPTPALIEHGNDNVLPSSFALDTAGEIVVADYNGGLYRMVQGKLCP